MHQLLGGQTKKIKTYGRKQNERVIPATNALKLENDTVSVVNSESFNFTLNHVKNQQSKGSTLVKNIPMSKHCTSPNKTGSHGEKTFEGEQRRRENALTDNSMLPDNASPEKHSVSTEGNGKTSSSAEDSRLPLTPKNPNNIQLQVKKIEPTRKLKTMVKPKLNRSLKISSPIECENDKNHSDQIYANQASCKEHEVESLSNEVKVLLIEKSQETKKPKTIEQLGANNTSVSMMITTGLTKVASLLLRNKSQESEDELTTLLKLCDQKKIYTFDEYIGVDLIPPNVNRCMRSAVKIGEASFSEVFAAYAPQFTAKKVKSVFKIIPFGRGKEILINGEEQCSIRDISQEVKTTLELGGRTGLDPNLRVGFLQLYSVAICRGKYPELLLNKWDRWDAEHKSESSRPDYFDERQVYVVFVEEHGGQSLETARLKNWAQAWSLLAQVGWSLAQVEQSLKFEVCGEHKSLFSLPSSQNPKIARISYDIASDTKKVEVPTFGIKTSIIDYTLSRMERDQEIIYVDISDESYFTGQGDHQYDVYRKMREETKGDWKSFWPKTNVFWLRYLADKLLTSKSLPKPRKSNDQHPYYHAILQFEKKAEKYSSAMEAMNKDESWRI
ncbi:13724_t:CDS:2 [Acaulospora morrowiae]|uniref:non-specific serine/threonine protein kinase n=1 Tax=Acaulospora morrowiae TaxID=94023 RepID=A0A9N9EJN1_9GLOM|nr:13724_t:CDS:2 [Acaulospora morrowiae]